MADAFVRIGDPERSAATELLEGQLRAGRITPEDFTNRVQRIATCRTVRDLDSVMVGFQPLAAQPELNHNKYAALAVGQDAVAPTPEPTQPGWYEVLDPWDKPLGQSPLTLRKARRIGWIFAITVSVFTAQPLSLLFPSALEALIIFSPILVMVGVSFWMAPDDNKTYRWVANPQGSKTGSPAAPSGYPAGAKPIPPTPALPAADVAYADPPVTPKITPVVGQPTPWNVEGPTFPTVGEDVPFDQGE